MALHRLLAAISLYAASRCALAVTYTYANFCDWPHLQSVYKDSEHPVEKAGTDLRLVQYGQPGQLNGLLGPEPLNVSMGFDFEFAFSMQPRSMTSDKGEGFALVFLPGYKLTLGEGHEYLGYGGMEHSVALEFDTRQDSDLRDPNDNHISWHAQGIDPNSAAEVEPVGISGCTGTNGKWYTTGIPPLANGERHTARVQFDPLEGRIFVYIDEAPGAGATLQCDINLRHALGVSEWPLLNVAFTAANDQDHTMDVFIHLMRMRTGGGDPSACAGEFTGPDCLPQLTRTESCAFWSDCNDCVGRARACCGWEPDAAVCTNTTINCRTGSSGQCPELYCIAESIPSGNGGHGTDVVVALIVVAGILALVVGVFTHVARRRRASGLNASWRVWEWSSDAGVAESQRASARMDYTNL